MKTIKSSPAILNVNDRHPGSELLSRVNALQSIATLDVNATIKVIDLKLSKQGKVENYRPADGKIVLQRPEFIRMLIRVPVIKSNIADMTSDGEHFKIAIYYPDEYRQFLIGSNNRSYVDKFDNWKKSASEKEKLSSLAKIRPQHITDALLIKPISLDNPDIQYFVADERQEETDVRPDGQSQRVIRTYEVLYVLERVAGGELKLQRQFWFDLTQPSLPLAKMLLFNNGMLVLEARYKQYKKMDNGMEWPQTAEIIRAQDNYALEINFDEVKQNNPIDKRAFMLENIQKLPERDLDSTKEPPRASPNNQQ